VAAAAVFFDVDGTLVPDITSGQHLAQVLGRADVGRDVEARYAAGTLTSREAAVIYARTWTGRTVAEVPGFLASLPLVAGIAETVLWCRRHHLVPVLATLAWDVVGTYLCDRFGFDRACGPRLEVIDGAFSGRVAEPFDEQSKRSFAARVAAGLGVELRRCAAVGDGPSDVPLFAEVGFAVAFNAGPATRAAAHASVDGPDLRAVLPLLGAWLEGS
jgi:phosphoserine phosphatase